MSSYPPVPQVVDGLLARLGPPPDANGVRFGTAPGVVGARIFDGPPLNADIAEIDAVAIGLSIDEGDDADGQVRHDLRGDMDSFDLLCLAQSWSGDVEIPPRRVRAFQMFGAVAALLPELVTELSAVLVDARISRWSYQPRQSEAGALVLVEFAVRVDAYR